MFKISPESLAPYTFERSLKMKKLSLLVLPVLLIFSSCHSEVTGPPTSVVEHTFTDPSDAVAFAIQGEYGSAKKTGNKWGVQVVALGKGNFDAYLLEGGLPGAGWERGKGRHKLNGKLEASGDVVLKNKNYSAVIHEGQIVVHSGDTKLTALKHIYRQSPTLGAKAPGGATVLYATAADEKKWRGKKGQIVKGNLLQRGVTSVATFQDHRIHFEFLLPFKPLARGQGRGNSGYYVQGRYETQILDSFGLQGRMNECGGVYSIAAPSTNACFPALVWQTYDVDFTAAKFNEKGKKIKNGRMTVKLNGILIHDDLDLTHSTTASPQRESAKPGPVHFQHHGNNVQFRNVWVVPK
jgi:hypothetical protein